jgi:hypothetical protein
MNKTGKAVKVQARTRKENKRARERIRMVKTRLNSTV